MQGGNAMTELENLARKAVEATKAYETFTSEKNVTSMLQAIAAFRAVVTPEDWLKQTETVEKAEREQITAVDSMLRTEQDIGTIATRLMKAEAALREFACSCPGPCERKRNDTYADRDASCRAHDALTQGE